MSETAEKQAKTGEATAAEPQENKKGQNEGQEIFKNEFRIKARIKQAERILKPIKELFEQMRQDGMTPTIDDLRNFMSEGPGYIQKQLRSTATEAVKSLKIKNKKVESALIDNSAGMLSDTYGQLHFRLTEKVSIAGVQWEDLLVLKGEPMLSEAFKNRIEKQFSATLDTADKEAFWNEVEAFCDSFNRMEELAQKIGLPSMGLHLNPGAAVFLTIEKEEDFYIRIKPNPAGFVNIFSV